MPLMPPMHISTVTSPRDLAPWVFLSDLRRSYNIASDVSAKERNLGTAARHKGLRVNTCSAGIFSASTALRSVLVVRVRIADTTAPAVKPLLAAAWHSRPDSLDSMVTSTWGTGGLSTKQRPSTGQPRIVRNVLDAKIGLPRLALLQTAGIMNGRVTWGPSFEARHKRACQAAAVRYELLAAAAVRGLYKDQKTLMSAKPPWSPS
jgi:hypothetical protein